MRNRTAWVPVSLVVVALGVALSAPALVRAQDQASFDPSMQPINVKLEKSDIRAALKQLFNAAKISYTMDEDVHGTVTASFEQTPFRVALERLLQSAPMPLTYRVESGIYSIQPRDKSQGEEPQPHPLMIQLHPSNTTAAAIVQKLKALPQFGPNTGVTYQVNPGDNSILVISPSEEQYRDLQQAVRLLDVSPREVSIRAEVVLLATGKGDKNRKAVVAMQGRTASEGTIKLQTTTDGKPVAGSPVVFSAGDYNITLKPTINGDDSIQVEAEVNLDLTYRLSGDARTQHLRNKFTGSGRYVSGETMLLASALLKSQDGKSDSSAAELLIFLTPNLVQPRQPLPPAGNLPNAAPAKPNNKRESPQAPPTHKE